jgi:lipopolysaccharide transport system permease protein
VKNTSNPNTLIDSADRSSSFRWSELLLYADLLRSFVLRDWKVRYGQTRLGLAWIVVQPILSASILALVFGLIVKREASDIPYPLFVLSGWMCWSYFSSSALQSVQLVPQYQAMMRKVYFPKAVLPLSKLIGLLPEFLVGLLLSIIYGAIVGELGWRLLVLPLCLPLLWLSTAGVVIWSTALGGSFRDIQQLVPYFFQMLFFLSPVAFPFGLLGDYLPDWGQSFLYLNPIAGYMDFMRYILFDEWILSPNVYWSLLSAIVLLLTALRRFANEERKWTDGL